MYVFLFFCYYLSSAIHFLTSNGFLEQEKRRRRHQYGEDLKAQIADRRARRELERSNLRAEELLLEQQIQQHNAEQRRRQAEEQRRRIGSYTGVKQQQQSFVNEGIVQKQQQQQTGLEESGRKDARPTSSSSTNRCSNTTRNNARFVFDRLSPEAQEERMMRWKQQQRTKEVLQRQVSVFSLSCNYVF